MLLIRWRHSSEKDIEPETDDDDDSGEDVPNRYAYAGRGNVQLVRAARKQAGLSESFPRTDPLLTEFENFMRAAGAAEKDIWNKVKFDNLL